MLTYPSGVDVSSSALHFRAASLREHRRLLGTRWRRLNAGRQALLAGGVNLNITQDGYDVSRAFGAISPSGCCHTFDERADGFVRGEGGVVLVLKPLSAALADGDAVHVVIRGSAVNDGGGGDSLNAPRQEAQQDVLRLVCAAAGVSPGELDYVELHATPAPAARHDLPYHVIGSDLSGVVLRTGAGVRRWRPGDRVVAHCLSVELEDAAGHDDTMLDPEQRIWGLETNYGGLAELALVKANQLMPKAGHLTWEEAAAPGLVNSTAYRQLVSRNGAAMKVGDTVLIWGAGGGLGSYASQYALAGGATPICVVSSEQKAEICRAMGVEAIIDRGAENYRFWRDEETQDQREWKRFGKRIRELTGGDDVDIVFEHPGRETLGASVYVARRGGAIVTCASTSGYRHEFDNRYLWMHLKRIIGSHFANYREAWEANRLVVKGRIHPTLSRTYPLAETGRAVADVHRNHHHGKVGVLCLAPREGLGVTDPELRERHEPAINRFRTE